MAISYEKFVECVKRVAETSDRIDDGWRLQEKTGHDSGCYLTKKVNQTLRRSDGADLLVVFEYHVVYSVNYGVPVLCFVAWKQDGSLLQMEEYRECNKKLADTDVLTTLTQLDHPVLCRPFLTLHPCRTAEIMQSFAEKSKNPVVSWLSVVAPFLDLQIDEEYTKIC